VIFVARRLISADAILEAADSQFAAGGVHYGRPFPTLDMVSGGGEVLSGSKDAA